MHADAHHVPINAFGWVVVLALSTPGWCNALWAQGQSVRSLPFIEYASPDQSVWTTRTQDNGEPDNPLNAVAAALFSGAGMDWKPRSYPASRLFAYLQDGTAKFSMLVKAPALQACCIFSKQPIATAEIRAYRRAGVPRIRSKDDLRGRPIIVIRGYSYGGLATFFADESNRITLHDTQAHASAFRMLANARADYLIDYAGPAREVLAADPIEGIGFDVLSRQEVHLVLSRTYPDAQRVMLRLEAVAATLDVEALLASAATGKALPPVGLKNRP